MGKSIDLIDRYVALWNERDADVRRKSIAELWVPDGATCHRLLDSRGYDAIEARVAGAYVFRSRGNVAAHHNVVKFDWEIAA